ncbi:unnamed protein product [marine sediment metagenome]|uniref:Uncharacterized protein n=1 Tax=marine sediment metagenome TaxID=412755 RepID=X1RTE6_9ZZZZ
MVMGQQIRPGQVTAFPATAVTPAFDITTLLTSIMPLVMLILVFSMLKPMFAGMSEMAKD